MRHTAKSNVGRIAGDLTRDATWLKGCEYLEIETICDKRLAEGTTCTSLYVRYKRTIIQIGLEDIGIAQGALPTYLRQVPDT